MKDVQFDLPLSIVLRPNEAYTMSTEQRNTFTQTDNTTGRFEGAATASRCQ